MKREQLAQDVVITDTMNIRSREVELPYYVKLALILVSIVIIVYGLHTLEGLLLPLVFAILFAVLLFPLVQRLEKLAGAPNIGHCSMPATGFRRDNSPVLGCINADQQFCGSNSSVCEAGQ